MTIIEPLYRRLGIVSTLWLAGMAPNSTFAQKPVVREAESILVDHEADDLEPVRRPLAVAPDPVRYSTGNYMTGNYTGDYGFVTRDCRNNPHCRQPGLKGAMRDCYWGYPDEFNERPFGTQVRTVMNAQIASGIAVQMVFYRFDFDGDRLSPRGLRQAWRISERMRMVAAPVIVEPTGNAALDLARREQVVVFMQQVAQIPIVPDSVVIGQPPAPGIGGAEAIAIQNTVIRNLQMGGAPVYNPEFGEQTSNSGVNSVSPGAR